MKWQLKPLAYVHAHVGPVLVVVANLEEAELG